MQIPKENLHQHFGLDCDDIDLYYLSTIGYHDFMRLSLREASGDGDNYDKKIAELDKDQKKYETKELNGWKIIFCEQEVSLQPPTLQIVLPDLGDPIPGYDFYFYYELSDDYLMKAKGLIPCDRENADLFMEKFVNNISFEKVEEDKGVSGVEVTNYDRIELNDSITLNLENGTNYGVSRVEFTDDNRPTPSYQNMINYAPVNLIFDGQEIVFVQILEVDKSLSDFMYTDENKEYQDFEYKGIKLKLTLYTSTIDVLEALNPDGDLVTKEETRLQTIDFETDQYYYRVYALLGGKEMTTEQDYKGFINAVLDRLLVITK